METLKNEVTAEIFNRYPVEYRESLLKIRKLILETASEISPSESVSESLKWNQPSYSIKGATPIRIDRFGEDKVGVFFNCQTTLVESFREMFSDCLIFSKNRAIILNTKEELPVNELKHCFQMALTYHQNK